MRRAFTSHTVTRIPAVEGDEAAPERFTFVASTPRPSVHDGLVVMQNWDLSLFRSNGVVIIEHDRDVRNVIGRGVNPRMVDGNLLIDVEFHDAIDEATGTPVDPLARTIAAKVRDGFVRMCSVGFKPGSVSLRRSLPTTHPLYTNGEDGYGIVMGHAAPNLLHELTICAIGADSDALHRRTPGGDVPLAALVVDLLRNDASVREAARAALEEPPGDNAPETLDAFVERGAPETLDAFLKR